jgi:hypothetical protein
LGTFDLHALAQLNTSELGVLHGLVSPEVAYNLEESGVSKRDNPGYFLHDNSTGCVPK